MSIIASCTRQMSFILAYRSMKSAISIITPKPSTWTSSSGFALVVNFHPEDVTFENAVTPIKLGKPDLEDHLRGVKYRRFHASGKFSMDFLDKKRPYGSRVIGTSFKHRSLHSSNVLYVVDLLGIDLSRRVVDIKAYCNKIASLAPPETGILTRPGLLRTLFNAAL